MIERSAFLELCPHCELHAHIHFSDDSNSDEFVDKSSGKELLRAALNEKKIDESEFVALREQIEDSKLSEKDGVQQKLMQLFNGLQKMKSIIDSTGNDPDIPRCQDFILN